jgi:ribosomal protein S18 acetylase RimI-like enzyme
MPTLLVAVWAAHVEAHLDPARLGDVFAWGEQVGQFHPTEPHWYLAQIAVTPGRQGRGHGSALLRSGLERCDRDGLPAYLESSSPRNRALYERHGFDVIDEVRVADSPPIWPMLRPPVDER